MCRSGVKQVRRKKYVQIGCEQVMGAGVYVDRV